MSEASVVLPGKRLNPRWSALRELGQRYAKAWRFSWQHRAEMEPLKRDPHEAQFLPAALALQETPVSPAPRVVMWLLIAFAFIALLWATLGHIDVVATAHGKVVPNDRSKTIQPFETATVKAIHVSDGQAVKAGDVLMELDATTAFADRDRVHGDLSVAQLQAARSQAMLASLDTGRRPVLLKQTKPAEAPKKTPLSEESAADTSTWTEAERQLSGQWAEYQAKQSRISAEMGKRQAELQSTQTLVHKLEQTLPIARQREQDYKNLIDENFVSKHGYMEREQARIEQEADLANLRSRLIEMGAALKESQSQSAELKAETRRMHLDSLTDAQQKVAALTQDLLKADTRGKLMRLTSPVDGTVQQLMVHTVGGVVTPAQALMTIVPRDHSVEVEAFLENKDIGFVNANQEAEVKVETFQYTRYGTLPAKVTSVSHDAIQDEKRGLIYSTRVKLNQSQIKVDGALVNLSPGMAVSVEIKTGKRRVIDYFLSPLVQHTGESLRER
jgi:hemolysin D